MRSITLLVITFWLFCSSYASAQVIRQESSIFANPEKRNSKTKKQSTQTEQEPLDFSDTGRPGQQTAGESRGSCSDLEGKIEAIVPTSHAGKTVSGHPSFWIHFPYSTQQISHIEFILQNEAREDIWRSQFKQNHHSGYTSFSLPKTEPPLKVNQWYRWYLKVYCDSHLASAQYVQSWIQRIPLSSKVHVELQQDQQLAHHTYSKHGIWYDAINSLLNQYQNQPNNLALEQDWQNLIKARGVELDDLPPLGATYEAIKYSHSK